LKLVFSSEILNEQQTMKLNHNNFMLLLNGVVKTILCCSCCS